MKRNGFFRLALVSGAFYPNAFHSLSEARSLGCPPLAQRVEDGKKEESDGRYHEEGGDGTGEKDGRGPLAHQQALAEGDLCDPPQDEGQDQGRQGVVELAEDVAREPEDKDQPDVEHAVGGGESADAANHQNEWAQDGEGHP